MSKLLADISAIITDADRMGWDIEDPMRSAKRQARSLALEILTDAARQAQNALWLIDSIERDYREAISPLGQQGAET